MLKLGARKGGMGAQKMTSDTFADMQSAALKRDTDNACMKSSLNSSSYSASQNNAVTEPTLVPPIPPLPPPFLALA